LARPAFRAEWTSAPWRSNSSFYGSHSSSGVRFLCQNWAKKLPTATPRAACADPFEAGIVIPVPKLFAQSSRESVETNVHLSGKDIGRKPSPTPTPLASLASEAAFLHPRRARGERGAEKVTPTEGSGVRGEANEWRERIPRPRS